MYYYYTHTYIYTCCAKCEKSAIISQKKNKLKKKKKCNTSLCVIFVVLHEIHEGIVKLRGSIKNFIELYVKKYYDF